MDLGMAPAIVGRVSYTGDLGYEIWMKPEYQRYLFDLLMQEGADLGIRLFGLRALNALRLEKSYGSWAREYRPLYGPVEAGAKAGAAAEFQRLLAGRQIAFDRLCVVRSGQDIPIEDWAVVSTEMLAA